MLARSIDRVADDLARGERLVTPQLARWRAAYGGYRLEAGRFAKAFPAVYSPAAKWLRLAGSVLYWLAVFAISLAIVIAVVLFLESRDLSSLGAE